MTNRMEQPSRGRAQRVIAFAVFALLSLCLPGAASAQWAPSSNGATNISNTNTGNVGVGTAAPASKLEVKGDTSDTNSSALNVTDSSGRALFGVRNDGLVYTLGQTYTGGQASIGDNLYVSAPAGKRGTLMLTGDGDNWAYANLIIGPKTTSSVATGKPIQFYFEVRKDGYFGGDASGPSFVLEVVKKGGGYFAPLVVNPNGNVILAGASNVTNGNVGIGTTAPSSKLHVAGDITVDGNINAKYQDVAEWVPSTQKLSPGTVVILDPERPNHVLASSASYDTAVAGVVSARPGLTLGEPGDNKALVATTGRVKVRVDATRAPIRIGDLLVTSDVAGVAMKSEPVPLGGRKIHAPGTIIGKALEPLAGGAGEILVLLSLQ